MSVKQQVRKIGGSLGILIPRDIAAAMNVTSGSQIRLTLVGRQLVAEPTSDTMDKDTFRRAFAAVLRREAAFFKGLAEYDQSPDAGVVKRRAKKKAR
jgi:antitoxin component of MazEF toxin-antitoxin module